METAGKIDGGLSQEQHVPGEWVQPAEPEIAKTKRLKALDQAIREHFAALYPVPAHKQASTIAEADALTAAALRKVL